MTEDEVRAIRGRLDAAIAAARAERDNDIHAALAAGWRQNQVAALTGLSRETVRQAAARAGRNSRKPYLEGDAMIRITSPQQLDRFRRENGVREDWHEPGNQAIGARLEGAEFDNAGGPGGHRVEMHVVLSQMSQPRGAGRPRAVKDLAVVNLADLLAWATDSGSGPGDPEADPARCGATASSSSPHPFEPGGWQNPDGDGYYEYEQCLARRDDPVHADQTLPYPERDVLIEVVRQETLAVVGHDVVGRRRQVP